MYIQRNCNRLGLTMLGIFTALALPTFVSAQPATAEGSSGKPAAHSMQSGGQHTGKMGANSKQDLTTQIAELQEQVSQLQIQSQQQGVSTPDMMQRGMQNRRAQMMGMKKDAVEQRAMPAMGGGMGMMDGNMMEMMGQMMGGMGKGMGAMGQMGGGALSALPGYPGASHLYHIGATNFFLDHPEHITLSSEQQKTLSTVREQALAEQGQADRKISELESELWQLTSVDQPSLANIESKLKEIGEAHSGQRLAWIKSVGEATKALTDEQRQALLGQLPPIGGNSQAPMGGNQPAGAMPSGGAMGDM